MHPAGCPSGNVVRHHKSRLAKFAMLLRGLEPRPRRRSVRRTEAGSLRRPLRSIPAPTADPIDSEEGGKRFCFGVRRPPFPHADGYPIADAIWKIGKYIAITMKPITVPRNTIIIGSSSAVSDATA